MAHHQAVEIHLGMGVCIHHCSSGGNTHYRRSSTTQQIHVDRPWCLPSHVHQCPSHSKLFGISSLIFAASVWPSTLKLMACISLSLRKSFKSPGLEQDQQDHLPSKTPAWTFWPSGAWSHLRCPHCEGLSITLGPGDEVGVPCSAGTVLSTHRCVVCESFHALVFLRQALMFFSSSA